MFFRRKYYDAEPVYLRENTPNWYQQLPTTNEAIQRVLLDLIPGKTALEIGCGGGWLGRFLLQNQAKSYSGFDFSETAIAYANKRVGKFSNARVFLGDALEPSSYLGGADLIVAHQFAQCLIGLDRTRWLKLAREAIHPKGVFVMSTMVGIPSGLVQVVDPVTRTNRFRNRYFATEAELQEELLQTGYRVEQAICPEKHMLILLARPENA
jgi:cyclopropane fatty-acyl-phospholipid synthase-like methyltransferase